MKAKHWPANRQPTPDEWLTWFHRQDPQGQLKIATEAIDAEYQSVRCVMTHHGVDQFLNDLGARHEASHQP